MRHFHMESHIACDHRDMFYDRTSRHTNIGDGVYTLTNSNISWPSNVSFNEFKQARIDVLSGIR